MLKFLLKALPLIPVVYSWSITALRDGKVTMKEGADLVERMCKTLGVPCDLKIKL